MPLALLLIGGTALVGGAVAFGVKSGEATGQGAADALVIVGIGTAVAVVLYAAHLGGGKK